MRGVFAWVAFCGCSFEPSAPPTNNPPADVDAGADVDAEVLGDWSEPVLVAQLASPENDDDPSLTSDLLEIYFASTRLPTSPDEDIYVARRASIADPFGPPELVPDINTQFLESNVDITADGLVLVFTSDRDGGPDLYMTKRSDLASPWEPVVALAELNSAQGEYGAVLSTDRLRVVLCSDRGPDEALFAATRGAATDMFSAPQKLAELDTGSDECDAMVPDATQTIYFTRSMGVPGDLDLFVAGPTDRLPRGDGAASVPVSGLNTTMRDGDPWVSPDQRTMFFASNRAGGATDDIYMSTR